VEIIIGTKMWSSWSMRPWLVLKHTGYGFDERLIPLREHGASEAIAAFSPSGFVPVLKDGDLTIWDSLAICEHLAERFPDKGLWPADRSARALARSVAAEVHSGFASLRGECPMDLARAPHPAELSEATQDNIRRIVHLCADLRRQSGGSYLFGAWSIADAFLTPIATRFRTYGVKPSDYGDRGEVGTYMEALLETPEYLAWENGALAGAAS
jgi:glutathione S-transferase